jgi:hypothetical protein
VRAVAVRSELENLSGNQRLSGEVGLLRERALGKSLWEAVLPAELRELPAELARVDELFARSAFWSGFGAG